MAKRGAKMNMEWMTIGETSKLWGVTIRQVQYLCTDGKIEGAQKLGNQWVIPKGTVKPIDGRTKEAKTKKNE